MPTFWPTAFISCAQAFDDGFAIAPDIHAEAPGIIAYFDEILDKLMSFLNFEAVRAPEERRLAAHFGAIVEDDLLPEHVVPDGDFVAVVENREDFHTVCINDDCLR